MTKHVIIPAHDERVIVDIEIPRPGRAKSLRFKAARLDFQPAELVTRYAEDYAKLRNWVEAVTDGKDADELPERPLVGGEHEFDHPLGWWAYALEMPDAEAINNLTAGERDQVWRIWEEAAETPVGESSASSD